MYGLFVEIGIRFVDDKSLRGILEQRFVELEEDADTINCLYLAFIEKDNKNTLRYIASINRADNPVPLKNGKYLIKVYTGEPFLFPYPIILGKKTKNIKKETSFESLFVHRKNGLHEKTRVKTSLEKKHNLKMIRINVDFAKNYNLPEEVPVSMEDEKILHSGSMVPVEAIIEGIKKYLEIHPKCHQHLKYKNFLAKVHLGFAVNLFMEKKLDEALKFVEYVVSIDPKNPVAHYYHGNILFDMHQYKKAIEHYQMVVKLAPEEVNAIRYLGASYMMLKDYTSALKYFRKALKKEPNDITVMGNMGKCFLSKGEFKKAIKQFEEILKIDDSQSQAQNFIALCYANQGDLKKAISIWEKLKDILFDDHVLLLNLGRAYLTLGYYYRALRCYENVLELVSSDSSLYDAAKTVIDELEETLEEKIFAMKVSPKMKEHELIEHFIKKFDIQLTEIPAKFLKKMDFNLLDRCLLRLDFDERGLIQTIDFKSGKSGKKFMIYGARNKLIIYEAFLKTSLEESFDELYHHINSSYIKNERRKASISQENARQTVQAISKIPDKRERPSRQEMESYLENARAIVKAEPKNEWAHYSLGGLLTQLDKIDEALEEFTICVNLNPNNSIAHHALGAVYVRKKMYDEAILQFQKSIICVPDNQLTEIYNNWDYKESIPYFDLGEVYIRKNMYREAAEVFEKGLAIDARVPLAHFQLGNCYARLSELEKAKEKYTNCILLDNGYAPAFTRLGIINYFLKDFISAGEHLKSAIEINPADAEAHLYFGLVLLERGENNLAKKYLLKVGELTDTPEIVQQATELLEKMGVL